MDQVNDQAYDMFDEVYKIKDQAEENVADNVNGAESSDDV